jgi:hypothetical protein
MILRKYINDMSIPSSFVEWFLRFFIQKFSTWLATTNFGACNDGRHCQGLSKGYTFLLPYFDLTSFFYLGYVLLPSSSTSTLLVNKFLVRSWQHDKGCQYFPTFWYITLLAYTFSICQSLCWLLLLDYISWVWNH